MGVNQMKATKMKIETENVRKKERKKEKEQGKKS